MMRRFLSAIPPLTGFRIIPFLIARLPPGDPIRLFPFGIRDFTQEDYLRLLHAYGLDKPIPLQYVDWISNAVRLNFGDSLIYHREAGAVYPQPLPPTPHPEGGRARPPRGDTPVRTRAHTSRTVRAA